MSQAVAMHEPPSDKGRRLRLYYMTQVAVGPPTFVLFVNDKELMHFSYQRYIENQIRETFDFSGTSIKLIIRERNAAAIKNTAGDKQISFSMAFTPSILCGTQSSYYQ